MKKTTQRKHISIAYSPDTDDAFMIEALRSGAIAQDDFDFTFHIGDIQELNELARSGRFDVTAISVAAWPAIRSEYQLMPLGASIGDGYGPAVVVHPDGPMGRMFPGSESGQERPAGSPELMTALRGKKIAVPGLATSAYFAARVLIGDFVPVATPFLEIAPAVERGDVDAGILIHERQLDAAGLKLVCDLGAAWQKRFALPLPLGANAIRRSLGPETISRLNALYRSSIDYGLANRSATLQRALAAAVTPGIDMATGDRYISMYVNADTAAPGGRVLQAIETFYAAALATGAAPGFDVKVEPELFYLDSRA